MSPTRQKRDPWTTATSAVIGLVVFADRTSLAQR